MFSIYGRSNVNYKRDWAQATVPQSPTVTDPEGKKILIERKMYFELASLKYFV